MSDRRDPEQSTRRKLARPGGRRAGDPPVEWLTVNEFADAYSVSRSTVHKWLRAEILEIYRVGALIRIRNLPPNQHIPTQNRRPIAPPEVQTS